MSKDWLVTNDGQCHPCPIPDDWEWTEKTYRLYRFLTDLDDILESTQDDGQILAALRPLVRRLLTSSSWLQEECLPPNLEQGWSSLLLYDEPNYPLTIQTTVWLPGRKSSIHNHATWAIVALLDGEEKNTLWRRNPDEGYPDRIEQVGSQILLPGDMISLTSDAIHQIEPVGDEPTVSFNVYGATDFSNRFEFDIVNHTAKKF